MQISHGNDKHGNDKPRDDKTGENKPGKSRRLVWGEMGRNRGWFWLLVLPYLGLCFPALYARTTPALFGFPFFYWYQFVWVILSSLLMGLVYLRVTERKLKKKARAG